MQTAANKKYGKSDEYTEEDLEVLEEGLKTIDDPTLEIGEDDEIWPFWSEEMENLYARYNG